MSTTQTSGCWRASTGYAIEIDSYKGGTCLRVRRVVITYSRARNGTRRSFLHDIQMAHRFFPSHAVVVEARFQPAQEAFPTLRFRVRYRT